MLCPVPGRLSQGPASVAAFLLCHIMVEQRVVCGDGFACHGTAATHTLKRTINYQQEEAACCSSHRSPQANYLRACPIILHFEVFCASAALRRRTAPEAGAGKQGRARSPSRQVARRTLRPWPHGAPCLPQEARCTVLTSARAKSFGAGRWKLHSNCVAAASRGLRHFCRARRL